jgi:hypothetical protein
LLGAPLPVKGIIRPPSLTRAIPQSILLRYVGRGFLASIDCHAEMLRAVDKAGYGTLTWIHMDSVFLAWPRFLHGCRLLACGAFVASFPSRV